ESVYQLAAPVSQDVLARLCLKSSHGLDHIVANDRGVAPDWLLQRARHHVLLRRVHHVTKEIACRHRLEGLCVCHVRAAPEQECVGILHQRNEARPDVIVPIGNRPSAMFEPAISILVLTSGGLYNAVQRHELGYNELSHVSLPCVGQNGWAVIYTSNESGQNRQDAYTVRVSTAL